MSGWDKSITGTRFKQRVITMARAKSAEQSRQRVKPTLVEELSRGIDKLRELSTQIDDLSRDGFPYGDAVRSRTELSLRETIRRLFGEKSPEYQAHRQHVLRVGTQAESSESLALLKELIGRLERQKAELLGLTPDVAPLPPASPRLTVATATSDAPLSTANTPTAETQSSSPPRSSDLHSNLDTPQPAQTDKPAPSPAPPSSNAALPAPQPPAAPEPLATRDTPSLSVMPPTTTPAAPPASTCEAATRASAPIAQDLSTPPSLEGSATTPSVATVVATQPQSTAAAETTESPSRISPPPSTPLASPPPITPAGEPPDSTLELLRKTCGRFHLIARQLRLRGEYRPTLEINDEYDLQDLFYALLRLQFDEVGTEEWSPPYANGTQRTTFLLDWGQTAVVVKQTRSGLSTKELVEQVKADTAQYAARPNGRTLVCFIYDPEGRVGNPRGLEADLTKTTDRFTVEVIVAPK